MKNLLAAAALVICTLPAIAKDKHEHREAGAHEHGHGSLNIAIEGQRVSIELEAPGADIVGFETIAKSEDEKAAVQKAIATLEDTANVLSLTEAAKCKPVSAEAETHQTGEVGHSEFHVTYTFECAEISKLTAVALPYFSTFDGAKELDVSVVSEKGQRKFEATPSSSSVDLGGLV